MFSIALMVFLPHGLAFSHNGLTFYDLRLTEILKGNLLGQRCEYLDFRPFAHHTVVKNT